LKSKLNLNVASPTNLTISFVTLWNFIGDVSISKHHTFKMFKTHSNFYYNLHTWYHKILTNIINFKLYLNFLEFLNYLDTRSRSCSLVKIFKILFWSHGKRLKLRYITWISFFHSFYSIIWITCCSNLTSFKLEKQLISSI
jgi:hypothetical protein